MTDEQLDAWMDQTLPMLRDSVLSWRKYVEQDEAPANPAFAGLTPTEINVVGGLNSLLIKVVSGVENVCICPECVLATHLRQKMKLEPEKKKAEPWKPLS